MSVMSMIDFEATERGMDAGDMLQMVSDWIAGHDTEDADSPAEMALRYLAEGTVCDCCGVYYGPGAHAVCAECDAERSAELPACVHCGSTAVR